MDKYISVIIFLVTSFGGLVGVLYYNQRNRITLNTEDIKKINENMATKDDLKDHKDSLRHDMSEMKGDIKLILNHILGTK